MALSERRTGLNSGLLAFAKFLDVEGFGVTTFNISWFLMAASFSKEAPEAGSVGRARGDVPKLRSGDQKGISITPVGPLVFPSGHNFKEGN